MGIYIKGLNIPRNEDGTFFKSHGDYDASFVMTLFADDKTGELCVHIWCPEAHLLEECYTAVEVKQEDKIWRLIKPSKAAKNIENSIEEAKQ